MKSRQVGLGNSVPLRDTAPSGVKVDRPPDGEKRRLTKRGGKLDESGLLFETQFLPPGCCVAGFYDLRDVNLLLGRRIRDKAVAVAKVGHLGRHRTGHMSDACCARQDMEVEPGGHLWLGVWVSAKRRP